MLSIGIGRTSVGAEEQVVSLTPRRIRRAATAARCALGADPVRRCRRAGGGELRRQARDDRRDRGQRRDRRQEGERRDLRRRRQRPDLRRAERQRHDLRRPRQRHARRGRGYDALYGGGGNDLLAARPAADRLDGGAGNDELWATRAATASTAGAATISLIGAKGPDRIYGGAGDDQSSAAGPDTLRRAATTALAGKRPTAWSGRLRQRPRPRCRGNDHRRRSPVTTSSTAGSATTRRRRRRQRHRCRRPRPRHSTAARRRRRCPRRHRLRQDRRRPGRATSPPSPPRRSRSRPTSAAAPPRETARRGRAGVEDLIGYGYRHTGRGRRLEPGRRGAGYDKLAGRGGQDELYGGPDGARCSGSGARALRGPADRRPRHGGRSRSIDGDVTLSSTAARPTRSRLPRRRRLPGQGRQRANPAEQHDRLRPRAAVLAARCADHVGLILIDVDGGADRVTIAGNIHGRVEVRIDGGPGADDLSGGPGDDIIEAGDDNDPDRLTEARRRRADRRADRHPPPFGSGRST